jgi:hypothetical protein
MGLWADLQAVQPSLDEVALDRIRSESHFSLIMLVTSGQIAEPIQACELITISKQLQAI